MNFSPLKSGQITTRTQKLDRTMKRQLCGISLVEINVPVWKKKKTGGNLQNYRDRRFWLQKLLP